MAQPWDSGTPHSGHQLFCQHSASAPSRFHLVTLRFQSLKLQRALPETAAPTMNVPLFQCVLEDFMPALPCDKSTLHK
eukprot:3664369-Amphidinium_carterae.1